jgi:putative PIN family toxin of toxin-antitoxin system
MKPQAVYDTNVIVSAILKDRSIPGSLVSLAMRGSVQLFLSPALLAEYTEVLKRPVFDFNPKTVSTFLSELENSAIMVYPAMRLTSALHEPDNRILECALEAKAQYVITGNKKHFPFAEFKGAKILSPAEFAAFLVV